MQHSGFLTRITRRRLFLGATGGVIALCIGLFLLFPVFERIFLNQLGNREASTLTLAVEGLNGSLRRFEALPKLIAERPDLARALKTPTDPALLERVNADLEQLAEQVGLSDIFLIDPTGLTIAASNHWKDRSFIGRSFAFRPYFTGAIEGDLGRFFALGTTSGERGYFFATAVRDGPDILGVLAIKFTVDSFEAAWRAGANDIIVTDDAGVIFMASRPEWHFRTLADLTPEALATIEATKKYPLDQLSPLRTETQPISPALTRLSIINATDAGETFIQQSQMIPEAGWQVSLLTNAQPAWNRAAGSVALTLLLVLLVGLIATVVLQRRMQLQERIRAALSMTDELEQRVAARTAELKAANQHIMEEVEERRAAETALRQAQTELVQAGKLAALGQMAAALSHEYNQPLTAVKSFARNALSYLDRGQPDKVRQNVGMIDEMVDRLAAISTHLRNFARRPGEKVEPVCLNRAIDSALAIVEPKIRAAGCRVQRSETGETWVRGGQVRLQQVFVNLLSNAVDATEGQPETEIDLVVETRGDQVCVHVRDRGAGMAETEIAQLFDPFFTTKEPGRGMGLGLSISYNIVRDFGGTLEGQNRHDGGAEFTVMLVRAESPTLAAAE